LKFLGLKKQKEDQPDTVQQVINNLKTIKMSMFSNRNQKELIKLREKFYQKYRKEEAKTIELEPNTYLHGVATGKELSYAEICSKLDKLI